MVRVEVKRPCRNTRARGPCIVAVPLIGAGLEDVRLGLAQRALVFQPIAEPRSFHFGAKIGGCIGAEIEGPVVISLLFRPSTMAPGPDDEEVAVVIIALFLPLIDLQGPVEILLIPPARHD